MVKIITDSAADFGTLAKEFDVDTASMVVYLNDQEYLDGIDITPDDIYENYEKTKKLPKTAAVNEFVFDELFGKYAKTHDGVIYIGISSKISLTVENAKAAAKNFDNAYVIDSLSLSTGISLLVIKACELAKEGKGAKEIVEILETLVPKVQASFVIDTLEFLYKGGRCSLLKAFGANLFKIKPQLQLVEGRIKPTKKFRGKQELVIEKYVKETIAEVPCSKDFCFITHTKMPREWIDSAVQIAKDAGFKKVYENTAGATITSHCGEGTLGILFIAD